MVHSLEGTTTLGWEKFHIPNLKIIPIEEKKIPIETIVDDVDSILEMFKYHRKEEFIKGKVIEFGKDEGEDKDKDKDKDEEENEDNLTEKEEGSILLIMSAIAWAFGKKK